MSASERAVVTVDLAGLPLDLGVVDALARLQLAVARLRGRVRLAQGGPDLGTLLSLCAREDVLPVCRAPGA